MEGIMKYMLWSYESGISVKWTIKREYKITKKYSIKCLMNLRIIYFALLNQKT